MIRTIAIDGPAASGKTVVGRNLARCLDFWFLDTGVMYRAVTWLALKEGIQPDDADGLVRLAEAVKVRPVSKDGDSVEIAGRSVGPQLRENRVNQNVSLVSRHSGVRRALVEQQRRYASEVLRDAQGMEARDSRQAKVSRRGIVMIGRDIGTVVMPDADLKVFLTASGQQRALRRWKEMKTRGDSVELETVLSEIVARDAIDSSRDDSPLRPADDAWQLDTSDLAVDEVVQAILRKSEVR